MLKVAIDATPVTPKSSGVGYYVANLIYALHTLQKTEDFHLKIVYQPGLKKWLKRDLSFPP